MAPITGTKLLPAAVRRYSTLEAPYRNAECKMRDFKNPGQPNAFSVLLLSNTSLGGDTGVF